MCVVGQILGGSGVLFVVGCVCHSHGVWGLCERSLDTRTHVRLRPQTPCARLRQRLCDAPCGHIASLQCDDGWCVLLLWAGELSGHLECLATCKIPVRVPSGIVHGAGYGSSLIARIHCHFCHACAVECVWVCGCVEWWLLPRGGEDCHVSIESVPLFRSMLTVDAVHKACSMLTQSYIVQQVGHDCT